MVQNINRENNIIYLSALPFQQFVFDFIFKEQPALVNNSSSPFVCIILFVIIVCVKFDQYKQTLLLFS